MKSRRIAGLTNYFVFGPSRYPYDRMIAADARRINETLLTRDTQSSGVVATVW